MSATAARSRASRVSRPPSFCLSSADALPLRRHARLGRLVGVEQRRHQLVADAGAESVRSMSLANLFCASTASRMPIENSAQSSNSELFQAGPRPLESTQYGVVGRLPP